MSTTLTSVRNDKAVSLNKTTPNFPYAIQRWRKESTDESPWDGTEAIWVTDQDSRLKLIQYVRTPSGSRG